MKLVAFLLAVCLGRVQVRQFHVIFDARHDNRPSQVLVGVGVGNRKDPKTEEAVGLLMGVSRKG